MSTRADDGDDPRLAESLRQALAASASEVHPRGDGLSKIRTRTATTGRQRWLVPVAAATAAIVVGGGVAWAADALDDRGEPPPVASGTTHPVITSAPPTATVFTPALVPTEVPAPTATVPVYYLGAQPTEDGAPSYRLFREYHRLPASDASDREERVRVALEEMFANAPLDDDYFGRWPATAEVLDVAVDEPTALVTVDLAGLEWSDVRVPDGRLVPEVGGSLVQQLVYTATGAASKITADDDFSALSVELLIDGAPADELLGVDTSGSLRRDPSDYQAIIWITDPEWGETVGDSITVHLVANLFEGGPPQWELSRDGSVVDDGIGPAGQGQVWDEYEFTIDGVAPGTYELEVFDVGGLGDRAAAPYDSKTFTVE